MLVAALAALPSASAEGPTGSACDSQLDGRAVCTGVAAGGTVECGEADAAVAACEYKFGWIGLAFSPAALPGEGSASAAYAVEACSTVHGCTEAASGAQEGACGWVAPNACMVEGGGSDSLEVIELELGECVTITVTVTAASAAWVLPAPLPLLTSAGHAETGEGGDQVCHLDDGR